jgi:hypothetical protein
MPWQAKLADHEDVERGVKHLRHFVGHWNAPARQGEQKHIVSIGIVDEFSGQLLACFGSVSKLE